MTEKLGSGIRTVATKGAPAGATVGGAGTLIVTLTAIYGVKAGLVASAAAACFAWLKNGGALDVRKILWSLSIVKSPVPQRRDGDRHG